MPRQRRRARASLLVVVCVLAVSAVCGAAGATGETGERWAVLIGISRYDSLDDLKYSAADARALKAVLERGGYAPDRIRLLVSGARRPDDLPTAKNVRAAVEHAAKTAGPDATVLVFFSGHGITRDGTPRLIPMHGGVGEGIPLAWIKAQLDFSKAGRKLLILDARHEGAPPEVNGIAPDSEPTEGMVMLFSCDRDQVSQRDRRHGHSVFAFYLLQALEGKAAAADGKVTVPQIFAYVERRVSRATSRYRRGPFQTPVLLGGNSADFAVIDAPGPGKSRRKAGTARGSAHKPKRSGAASSGDKKRKTDARTQPKDWTKRKKCIKVYTPAGERERTLTVYTNSIGMDLVRIPAGEFVMGSHEGEEGHQARESPPHRVCIEHPFLMSAHEVTQRQYKKIMGHNPSKSKGDDRPVHNVSWNDARRFCRKLSKREGATYRLPTEAEWECACRYGSGMPFYWGTERDEAARQCVSRGRRNPSSVGRKRPNGFGLYDMSGNVAEWCRSLLRGYPYRDDDGREDVDARGARVVRGGSCASHWNRLRAAARSSRSPRLSDQYTGFRVVAEIPEEQ